MEKRKFPNQKRVKIGEKEKMGRDVSYQRLTNDTAILLGSLSLWEIRIWLYLNKNAEGYEIDLSPQAILNWYGITTDCRKNVREGLTGLYNKGFLVEGDNKLVFYQKPFWGKLPQIWGNLPESGTFYPEFVARDPEFCGRKPQIEGKLPQIQGKKG